MIRRYKRFLADVCLADGETITVHCPNTGSMKNCAQPGWRVWLSHSDNPKRKYAHTWELVEVEQQLACVNTQRPNHIVTEAFKAARIAGFEGFLHCRNEVRYGLENSRIDLLLEDGLSKKCYVEVKNVTLQVQNSDLGLFPDAVTVRGRKHLRELVSVVEQGHRAVLFYCVAHNGINRVQVAKDIDPDYSQQLLVAMAAGVEVMAYRALVDTQTINITERLPFEHS